jgi:hypothetical protein
MLSPNILWRPFTHYPSISPLQNFPGFFTENQASTTLQTTGPTVSVTEQALRGITDKKALFEKLNDVPKVHTDLQAQRIFALGWASALVDKAPVRNFHPVSVFFFLGRLKLMY